MNTKIRLLYPPASVHEFPHLALPHLKGYLLKKGYKDVQVMDLNAPIMKKIIWSRLYRVSQYYEKKGVAISIADVEKNFILAKSLLFNEIDRGKDEWAISILNAYHKMAGSCISEICYSPNSLSEIAKSHALYRTDAVTEMIDSRFSDLIAGQPQIVGITIPMASQLFYAFYIGRMLKQCVPEVKVIFGGPQITLFGELILQRKEFSDAYDHLLSGEGEESLYQYIKYVSGRCLEQDIPGLIHLDERHTVVVNKSHILTEEHELPLPDFHDYKLDDYIYPKLPYMMNKGCYWSRCAFCSYRNDYPFVKKRIEHIIHDIQLIMQEYRIRFFHFIDDAIPPFVLSDFSSQIIEEGIKIKYENYLRLDPAFNIELCKKIAHSGLRSALFGLESANSRILQLMNKGVNQKSALHVLNNMISAGIKPVVSCMIGFPSETKAEAMETVNFLKNHKNVIAQSFIVRYGLISDMKGQAGKYGIYDILVDDIIRYDESGFIALGYDYKTREGMTKEQIQSMVRYGREQVEGVIFKDCFFS